MGELAKAKLIDLDRDKAELVVQFNPKELSITKSVSWTAKPGKTLKKEPPDMVYGDPAAAQLTVNLQFDTYEEKKPVTEYTDKLVLLSTVVKPDAKPARPPVCLFVWGKTVFQGVVTNLSLKFSMFLSDGTPVRCEAALTMQAAHKAVGKDDKEDTSDKDHHPVGWGSLVGKG